MATVKGTVKWFNSQKHYGYITDEQGNDHFVHSSGIKEGRMYPGFESGDRVEFEVGTGYKGPSAVNVVLTEKVENIPKEEEPVDEDTPTETDDTENDTEIPAEEQALVQE